VFVKAFNLCLLAGANNVPECCVRQAGRPEIEGFDADQKRTFMYDLIFIAVIALFFIASGLYARWCEKL